MDFGFGIYALTFVVIYRVTGCKSFIPFLLGLISLSVGAFNCASPPPTPTPLLTPQLSLTPMPLIPALEEGRNLYISKGCVNCHGPNLEFLVVVNLPEISEKAVMQQARNPTGMMPSFSTAAISDEELGKIARFVVSVLSQRGK